MRPFIHVQEVVETAYAVRVRHVAAVPMSGVRENVQAAVLHQDPHCKRTQHHVRLSSFDRSPRHSRESENAFR